MRNDLERYGLEIKIHLEKLRHLKGWTIEDLAYYLDVKYLTLRNSMHTCNWSDLLVTILKWAKAIPEKLAYDYKRALERERMDNRKKHRKESL